MTRRQKPVLTVILSGLCILAVVLAPAHSPERVLAGIMLVLVLPGFGLASLFPVASGRRQLLVIPVLSLTAVILLSGALYVVRIPLDLSSWSISLAVVAVLGHLLSLLRPARFRPSAPVRPRAAARPVAVAAVGVLLLLAGAAVVTAQSVNRQESRDRFTQLWAIPQPRGDGLTIGVYNHEGEPRRYRLKVLAGRTEVQSEELRVASGGTTRVTAYRPVKAPELAISVLSARPGSVVYRWIRLGLSGPGGFCGPRTRVPLPHASGGSPSCLQPRPPLLR